MAGRGRPPKSAGSRRNHHDPQRGDWVEVRGDERQRIPKLPARGKGRGVWSDPVSKMWREADHDLVLHLADVYEEWVRQGTASLASETRQLRDNLGLSPKGRQDRRWRITEADVHDMEQEREQRGPERSTRGRLRAVDPKAVE
jgi:hypothetical protein